MTVSALRVSAMARAACRARWLEYTPPRRATRRRGPRSLVVTPPPSHVARNFHTRSGTSSRATRQSFRVAGVAGGMAELEGAQRVVERRAHAGGRGIEEDRADPCAARGHHARSRALQ